MAEKKSSYLLITNKHVIPASLPPINLVFHKGTNEKPDLSEFKPIKYENYQSLIHFPSDKNLDLAALNLTPKVDDPELYWRHLDTEIFSDYTSVQLLAGNEVWFVGYPENIFDTKHNLPLLRKGFISSHPKIDYNGKPEIVIDAQVFPGSSGSPVFTIANSKAQLIGVVSETMIKNNQLQSVPTSHISIVEEVLGLGIVIKSTALKVFIDEVVAKIKEQSGLN